MKNVIYLLIGALFLVVLSIGVWLLAASGNVVVDKKLTPSGNENFDILRTQ